MKLLDNLVNSKKNKLQSDLNICKSELSKYEYKICEINNNLKSKTTTIIKKVYLEEQDILNDLLGKGYLSEKNIIMTKW